MATAGKRVRVGRSEYWITTDEDYGKHLGEQFEPDTVALLEALCKPNAQVLDIGANIGVTAVLLGSLAPRGIVAAVEPVPAAYHLLQQNVAAAGASNVRLHNFALGATDGTVRMQGNPQNLSGAFIADQHAINDDFHFSEDVRVCRLDDVFSELGLSGLDLVKIDVEGYELDVLEGGCRTLLEHKPLVMLEMNYVALNLWRRMSLPEFRERLLDYFPVVFALRDGHWLDFRDERSAHEIQFTHLTKFAYMDLVCGFDRAEVEGCLERLPEIRASLARESDERNLAALREQQLIHQCESLSAELLACQQRVADIEASSSWRITAPLRALKQALARSR